MDPRELSRLIKQLETEGLAFEGAEASLRAAHPPPGDGLRGAVPDRRLHVPRGAASTVASCWPRPRSRSRWTARSCTRPPTATARSTRSTRALRKALGAFYPGIDDVHLVDYKVRILDGGAATAARTRVIIDSQDGATGRGPRWAATRTSSRRRRRRWPTRWSTRSGSPGPSCAGATSATSRRRNGQPTARPREAPHDRRPPEPDPARPLDRHVGQQRPQPCGGRAPCGRPRLAGLRRGERRHRRAVPRRRQGARRGPRRAPAAARVRRPRPGRGPGRGGARDRPDRAAGRCRGIHAPAGATRARSRSTNIVAASVEAYIDALNAMLADPAWVGAAEAAGSLRGRGRARIPAGRPSRSSTTTPARSTRPSGSTARRRRARGRADHPPSLTADGARTRTLARTSARARRPAAHRRRGVQRVRGCWLGGTCRLVRVPAPADRPDHRDPPRGSRRRGGRRGAGRRQRAGRPRSRRGGARGGHRGHRRRPLHGPAGGAGPSLDPVPGGVLRGHPGRGGRVPGGDRQLRVQPRRPTGGGAGGGRAGPAVRRLAGALLVGRTAAEPGPGAGAGRGGRGRRAAAVRAACGSHQLPLRRRAAVAVHGGRLHRRRAGQGDVRDDGSGPRHALARGAGLRRADPAARHGPGPGRPGPHPRGLRQAGGGPPAARWALCDPRGRSR